MTGAFYSVFRIVWAVFFRIQLPEGKDCPNLNDLFERYARILTPVAGVLVGVVLWLSVRILCAMTGRVIAALLTAAAVPLVMEITMKQGFFRSMMSFINTKSQGLTSLQTLSADWDQNDFPSAFMPGTFIPAATFCLFRAGLYAVLAFSVGSLWFLMAWTGVFFLYAELSALPNREDGEPLFAVSKQYPYMHFLPMGAVFLFAGVFGCGVLPAFTAFLTVFGLSRLAMSLQKKADGEITLELMSFYGACMECAILLLGALIAD